MAGAATLSLASPWPAVAGADAAQVTVVGPGGVQRPLSLDALAGAEDVRKRGYLVRSAAGEETRTVTGFSLAAVLGAAGADTYGFSYLEVQRPVGGSVLLSRHQALDPGAFPQGPPVVYATAGGTGFLRPAADPADANGGDCFEAPQGVTVVLRKGTALRVRATASPRRARPGQRVEFSASVARAGAGEQLSYSWYFDDGGAAEGPTASHSFAKPGSYDIVVGVTTPGDDTGASAVVTVQVGAPAAGGPKRRGGGSNRAAGAPDSGAATGPGGPAGGSGRGGGAGRGGGSGRGSGAGRGGGTGGKAAGGGSSGGSPGGPMAGGRAAGSGAPDRTAGGPGRDTTPPGPAAAPATANPAASSSPPRRRGPRGGASLGERVSGLLLGEAGASPRTAPEAPAAAQPAAPDTGATAQPAARTGSLDEDGGLPTAAWGLLASAGLLGAGALLEARGLPALLPPWKPAR